jgi:antitoxin HigA-1
MTRLKPIHPGEILREEFMASFRVNANQLSLALHVPAPGIYEIVRERRGISPEMALRLGHVFGTTPDFWMNLQADFDLRVARNEKDALIRSQVHRLEVTA